MRPKIATMNDDFRFFMYPETVAREFLIKCFSFLHKKVILSNMHSTWPTKGLIADPKTPHKAYDLIKSK